MHPLRPVCALVVAASSACAEDSGWTHNEAMLTFFQAAGAIREHALAEADYQEIVHGSLQAYLRGQDPYSVLFTPSDYERYRAAGDAEYGGIGMELTRNRSGVFYCIPYPDSPASDAGVRERDELLSVNGVAAAGLSLVQLGALVRGAPDTPVELTVRSAGEEPRSVEVRRGRVRSSSVHTMEREGLFVLRVHTFTAGTPGELRTHILGLPLDHPIVIDLQGNPGGSLFDAVDAARLFLAPGQTIVSLRSRGGTAVYRAERPPPIPDRPVWILQDECTASAAEVFAAALTDNGRARSIGRVSYGKGHTQRIVELMDGSALLLTDGELLPPSGTPFDGTGLPPSIVVGEGPILSVLRRQVDGGGSGAVGR